MAGMLIGPWGLQLVSDVESTLHFSELGMVLLLFIIGLELQPSRLWRRVPPDEFRDHLASQAIVEHPDDALTVCTDPKYRIKPKSTRALGPVVELCVRIGLQRAVLAKLGKRNRLDRRTGGRLIITRPSNVMVMFPGAASSRARIS